LLASVASPCGPAFHEAHDNGHVERQERDAQCRDHLPQRLGNGDGGAAELPWATIMSVTLASKAAALATGMW